LLLIEFGGSGEALNAVAVATLLRTRFAANQDLCEIILVCDRVVTPWLSLLSRKLPRGEIDTLDSLLNNGIRASFADNR
jgi:hypothetical protein